MLLKHVQPLTTTMKLHWGALLALIGSVVLVSAKPRWGAIGDVAGVVDMGINAGGRIHDVAQRTYRVRNDMQHTVWVKCSEKGNTWGAHEVEPGHYYTVNFHPSAWTRMWCSVWPWNSDERTQFDSHSGHDHSHTYYLKYDGIYRSNLDGSHYGFYQNWWGHGK